MDFGINVSDELQFAVIAIETAAQKLGTSTAELTERLQKYDLIEGRLWKFYDMLHTQSRDYVADDLIEALLARESKSEAV
ncbi:MAG: DUF3791 domain-containing protein [Fibrobacteraceae bacterium]|nr:DUF3791 domain-containing protein [Fibrobacteraceae bacterium]